MVKKTRYEEITMAREVLDLPEAASMEMIKSNYRKLLSEWHPDICGKEEASCNEMVRKIVSAYQTLMAYCGQYRYSFTEEAVTLNLTPEQQWVERFCDDFSR
jgi:DnaJ-class molecular chaperone